MKFLRCLFRKPKPHVAPPLPPLIMRRGNVLHWDFETYHEKMKIVLGADVQEVLEELTPEKRQARSATRELGTPSEPTLYDANFTQVWDIYTAVTARMAVYWVYAEE